MKVLVISCSSLHLAVYSTPVIRALKVQLDAAVDIMAPDHLLFLYEENPYVDTIVRHDMQVTQWRKLKVYDVVVDLEDSFRMRMTAKLAGVRLLRFNRRWFRVWLMTRLKINKLDGRNMAEHMLEAVLPLEIKPDDLGLDYFIPERDHVPLEWLPHDFHRGFVLFSLQADCATRKLPLQRVIELCDKINKPILLVGAPEDAPAGDQVVQFFRKSDASEAWEAGLLELNKKTVVHNGCGKFNHNQVASLAKQAVAVFAFDGEMIPVASAFRKKIFMILGHTISWFGRYPYKTAFVLLENNKLTCRPCAAKSKCPLGHFDCMNKVVFDFYIP